MFSIMIINIHKYINTIFYNHIQPYTIIYNRIQPYTQDLIT